MLKVLEALDKLEECAYAMKDLPMSNWIDLAENEVELDLKIMDWVETIKFELESKQQSDRLEKLEKENQKLKEENQKVKKVIDFLKLKFDISLDSKLRISDGSECIQTFIVDLPENTTIDEMFEIIPEVLCDVK